MAKITIRFEPDPALDHIDVLIRAREQDAEVTALMERLSGQTPDTITVFDGLGNFRTLSQESILSAFAERKLVTIATEDGSWYTRRTLQNLEETRILYFPGSVSDTVPSTVHSSRFRTRLPALTSVMSGAFFVPS